MLREERSVYGFGRNEFRRLNHKKGLIKEGIKVT